LLAGFSERATRITPEMVDQAAASLDVQPPPNAISGWMTRRASLAAAAFVVLLSSILGAGITAYVYERLTQPLEARSSGSASAAPVFDPLKNRDLPLDATVTILVGSYPTASPRVSEDVRAMTGWLEAAGFAVYYAEVDHGPGGRWHRVLAGAYTNEDDAKRDLDRLKAAAPSLESRIVNARAATSASGVDPQ
jgi:hypothetical protein